MERVTVCSPVTRGGRELWSAVWSSQGSDPSLQGPEQAQAGAGWSDCWRFPAVLKAPEIRAALP